MKPGSTTAAADENLETETEETETEGADAVDALEDELTSAVTDALNEDDDLDEDEDDEDELDLEDEGEDLDDALADDDEEEEQTEEEGQGASASGDTSETDKGSENAEENTDAGQPAANGQPQWSPFAVTANKEQVPIEEAQLTKVGENYFLAIPEKQFARFQQRVQRGVLYERVSRQLEAERKELESRKNAPPRKTDAEIEAEITLEKIKPYLADLLDEKDMKLLEQEVKLAQREEADKYAKLEIEHREKANEVPWEETQVRGLADVAIEVWSSFPELKDHLTEEELQTIFAGELVPVKDALYRRDKDGQVVANTQYIYDRLKARATGKSPAGGKPAAEPKKPAATASASNPAPKGNPGTTAKPNGKTPVAAAERFNRGVDTNAARTTSVKANRTARPGKAATRDAKGKRRRRPEHVEQQRAEDTWRRTERAFLASDSLDFPDE